MEYSWEQDEQLAERHAQQLAGTTHRVALITVKPLSIFRHQERATIVLLETNDKGEQQDRVVNAVINSLGQGED